jgi:hypothetical protein
MNNIYEPDTKFNKIFMFIGNTITITTGCIGVISWIITQITKNIPQVPTWLSITFKYLFHFCVVAFIFGIIFILIRIIYVGIKSKSESLYIQRKTTEFLHRHLIHKIRNNIVELEPLSLKLQKFSKENNSDAISECYNKELEILSKNLKGYVNSLAQYLTDYRGSIISICIKVFKKRDRNREEFQSEEIITLARSSNTEKERNNNKISYVGQNTDFTNLCKGQIVFFGSSNLHKINESGHYINDSENWENDKYTSTLVTPIRYNNSSSNNGNNCIKSDIIGFLCIDSKDEIQEWENSDSFELQILAAFSDIIYVYIKEFYNCFENNGIIIE